MSREQLGYDGQAAECMARSALSAMMTMVAAVLTAKQLPHAVFREVHAHHHRRNLDRLQVRHMG